jgi:hypothetical protein
MFAAPSAKSSPGGGDLGLDKIHQSDAVVVTGNGPWSTEAAGGKDPEYDQYMKDHEEWRKRNHAFKNDPDAPYPGEEPVDPWSGASYGSKPGGRAGGGPGGSYGQDVSPYMKHNGGSPYAHYGD